MEKSRHLLSLLGVYEVLENAPLGNGVLLCALLSFLLLLVSRFPTGLVRFLRFAFPTCIRTGALWQLRFGV